MPVTDQHSEYKAHIGEWLMMREAVQGEDAVKANAANLPKPPGMVEAERDDPQNSYLYANYTARAQYPHWVKDGLRVMVGLVSRLTPEINIPAQLKSMEEEATADGFGLRQLFLRVCREVLLYGRQGLLVDLDEDGKPFIATYDPTLIINWKSSNQRGREDLSLVVVKESMAKDGRDRFSHETEGVYRVLEVEEGRYISRLYRDTGELIEEAEASTGTKKPLSFIPIVITGSTDNSPDVDEMPLLTMAKAALKSYQISADLYTNAHATCHAQPVVTGLPDDAELRVSGPTAAWVLPESANAFYLEVSGTGSEINERLMAKQHAAAMEAGARVIDIGGVESGEARKARQNDQHATLHTVVVTVAEAIEQCLKYALEWVAPGSNEEVVFSVKPDFTATGIDPAVAQQILQAVMAQGLSWESYWMYLRTGKLPDHEYDQEALKIEGVIPADRQEWLEETT